MLYLSPLLAIVSAVVAPAVLIVSFRMRWRIFPATWDGQQREGDVAQIVDEGVNGVRVVKAFGQERRELERLVESANRLYGSQMRAVRLQARYQPILQAIPSLGQVAILAVGGYLALEHQITIGTFLAFSTYVAQMVAPARMLAGVLTVAQQARAGVERIFQLIDLPPAIVDGPDAVDAGRLAGAIDFDARLVRLPGRAAGARGLRPAHGAGGAGGAGRAERERKVDGGAAGRALSRSGRGVRPRGRARRPRPDPPFPAQPGGLRLRGDLPLLRIGAGQHRLRPARRHRRRD